MSEQDKKQSKNPLSTLREKAVTVHEEEMQPEEHHKPRPMNSLMAEAALNTDSQMTAIIKSKGSPTYSDHAKGDGKIKISVDLIDPNPFQPRKNFDDNKIRELSDSIKLAGQIQPIVVRRSGELDGRFELIAGERRLRAVKLLDWDMIDAVIHVIDNERLDIMMSIMALAENLDREDLSDYETGIAVSKAQIHFKDRFEIADYFKRTRKDIDRLLVFNEFPSWIKERLDGNPRLISKTISQSINALLNSESYHDTEHRRYLLKAMDLLESGELTQYLFIDYIKSKIEGAVKNKDISVIKKGYVINGKSVGNFVYDSKRLSIRLNATVIDEPLANEIFHFIEEKIKGQGGNYTNY